MKLKVGLFQFDPSHLQPEKNFQVVKDAIKRAERKGVRLLVLPELWTCGLLETSEQAKQQALSSRPILNEVRSLCNKNHVFVAGTMPEKDGPVFNTLYITGPENFFQKYRKIHLFPLLNEEKIFAPGEQARDIWISINGQEVGLGCLICFDLRFSELARYLAFKGVDIIICSAMWPKARQEHFMAFLKTRAMENQCFLMAANACGTISGVQFAGCSSIIAPNGQILASCTSDPAMVIQDIEIERIQKTRASFFTARPPSKWAFHHEDKIMGIDELRIVSARRKRAGQKMVFTNGCFDILHAGHISYLRKARLLGDYLIVGLNSDLSVRAIKGKHRPINPEGHRAALLSGLSFVDYVVIFQEETPEKLIERLLPDILVKGADWDIDKIVGADFVRSMGGRVERVEFEVNTSTTSIIKKIKND